MSGIEHVSRYFLPTPMDPFALGPSLAVALVWFGLFAPIIERIRVGRAVREIKRNRRRRRS